MNKCICLFRVFYKINISASLNPETEILEIKSRLVNVSLAISHSLSNDVGIILIEMVQKNCATSSRL